MRLSSRPVGSHRALSFLFCTHKTSPLKYATAPPRPVALAVILKRGRPVTSWASRNGIMSRFSSPQNSSTTSLKVASSTCAACRGGSLLVDLERSGASGESRALSTRGAGRSVSLASPRSRAWLISVYASSQHEETEGSAFKSSPNVSRHHLIHSCTSLKTTPSLDSH